MSRTVKVRLNLEIQSYFRKSNTKIEPISKPINYNKKNDLLLASLFVKKEIREKSFIL